MPNTKDITMSAKLSAAQILARKHNYWFRFEIFTIR